MSRTLVTLAPLGLMLARLLLAGCSGAEPRAPENRPNTADPRVFTHAPTDLKALFSSKPHPGARPITPFFNYDNTAHAEGPRKWYLYGSQTEPLKVFLPTRASLSRRDIGTSGDSGELEINGEKVRLNVHIVFRVDDDLKLFFMHLCLRDKIAREAEQAGNRPVNLAAGTHIGYVHFPPWNSLDFGVEDRRQSSAMASDSELWWNLRANPLDYFTPELRQRILAGYRPVLEELRKDGTVPFSDLTDSRANINVRGAIWGVWFKDDLADPFREHQVNWSIINVVSKDMLHRATYWRVLQEYPNHAGLFTENGAGSRTGRSLYSGAPLGQSRFHILSGDGRVGTAKIVHRFDASRVVYLKFVVLAHDPEDPYDDQLRLESFLTAQAAKASGFSDRSVLFRRDP